MAGCASAHLEQEHVAVPDASLITALPSISNYSGCLAERNSDEPLSRTSTTHGWSLSAAASRSTFSSSGLTNANDVSSIKWRSYKLDTCSFVKRNTPYTGVVSNWSSQRMTGCAVALGTIFIVLNTAKPASFYQNENGAKCNGAKWWKSNWKMCGVWEPCV